MTRKGLFSLISLLAITMADSAGSQNRLKYSVLAIEYVGESDKPITPIVISDSKMGAEWYRDSVLKRSESELTYIHVVPVSLLERLISETESHKGILQSERTKSHNSSVSVTIVTIQRKNTFLYDRESAVLLLDNLRKRCKDYDSLRSDLAHFQDRIRL